MPKGSAGSYFYHSHVGFQAVSAAGPLIIEDKKVPFQYDADRIFFLQELFNKTDASVEQGVQAVPLVWSGETNGFIINGQTISNYGITDPKSAQIPIISVDPKKKYRLRFIGASALTYAAIGIEDHSALEVIEADGSYTKPHNTTFLQLGSGQRFSTILHTKTCAELAYSSQLDYYIQVESRERPANTTNYAILRYNNICNIKARTNSNISTTSYPLTKPVNLPPTVDGFLDYVLEPLSKNDFPSASEVTRRVVLNIQQIDDQWIVWRDSNVTWTDNANDPSPHTSPNQPYLVSLYENASAYLPSYSDALKNGGRDPTTNTFPANPGEVLEIVFQNLGTLNTTGTAGGTLDIHPWHAHGNHYYDAGSGPGAFSPDVLESRLKDTTPVLRDTTILYRYNGSTTVGGKQGWRAWRLRVEQPGVWMIHCHTLQHMLMGMQTVWVVGDEKELLKVPKPEVSGYLTYGGSAYGNSSHAPEVVHFSELASSTKGNATG